MTQHRSDRAAEAVVGRQSDEPAAARWGAFAGIGLALLVIAAGGCQAPSCWHDKSPAFDEAFSLGQEVAELRKEAYDRDRKLISGLKFEAFRYDRIAGLGSVPRVTAACGVSFRIPQEDKDWSIVPDLSYRCDDDDQQTGALEEAALRLRKHLNIPEDEGQVQLEVHDWPVATMRRLGRKLVSARALGVEFDFDSCLDRVTGPLADAAEEVAAQRCAIFLNPGLRVKHLREDLSAGADPLREAAKSEKKPQKGKPKKAKPKTAKPKKDADDDDDDELGDDDDDDDDDGDDDDDDDDDDDGEGGLKLTAAAAAVASSCGAVPGEGDGSGSLSGTPMAYRLTVDGGQAITLIMSSAALDPQLDLWDASCAERLAQDDDSGPGNAALIKYKPDKKAELTVVASGFNSSTGAFKIRAISGVAIAKQDKKDVEKFLKWLDDAKDDDYLRIWQGTSERDLALGCLNKYRYDTSVIARVSVLTEALSTCTAGLEEALAARRQIIQGESYRRQEKPATE